LHQNATSSFQVVGNFLFQR